MTKLDRVLERVRALPEAEQDALAAELEAWLGGAAIAVSLTPEQEEELSRRLADRSKTYVSHDEVAAQFEKKYGR